MDFEKVINVVAKLLKIRYQKMFEKINKSAVFTKGEATPIFAPKGHLCFGGRMLEQIFWFVITHMTYIYI